MIIINSRHVDVPVRFVFRHATHQHNYNDDGIREEEEKGEEENMK